MRIGFIGAGKVGFSLGKFFVSRNIQVTGYYSRHQESAKEAAKFTETKFYKDISMLIKDSDAIFVTVPDGQIRVVYDQLKDREISEKQICHCSVAMSSKEAFPDANEHGAFGYSIHPLFPVSSKYDSYQKLADAFFCLEGDLAHMNDWVTLFQNIGVKTRMIESENKVKYHAACAIASNLVCALFAESMELLEACGFEKEEALEALSPLAKSNMEQILSCGPIGALTGPIERGDSLTVSKHLACFKNKDDRSMYTSVSRKLISMAKEKHPEKNYKELEDLFQGGLQT